MNLSNEINRVLALSTIIMLLLSLPLTISAQGSGINCTVTPDQVLGQAFGGLAGVSGETADDGTTPEGEDISDAELEADIGWIIDNLIYSGSGSTRVAILVVDDFSSDGSDDVPASHGWLVFELLTKLHGELPDSIRDSIQIEQVDVSVENEYRADQLEIAISDTIESLTSDGVARFVVNMSFIMVPCVDESLDFDISAFLEQRDSDAGHSIIKHVGDDPDYVLSLLNDARITYIDDDGLDTEEDPEREHGQGTEPPAPSGGQPQFIQDKLRFFRLFENPKLQSDPLRDYFRQTKQFVVPVAAAGNFKTRRPFFPARWPEVISVSASEGSDFRFWTHSNNGAISVPGAWYLFEDDVYRAGTSFAAPVLSLAIAVDLTQDEPQCGLRGGTSELTSTSFKNTPLLDAVQKQCE